MSDCKHDDYQITVNGRCQRCGEVVAASSFAAPTGSVATVDQITIVCPHCGYRYMEPLEMREDFATAQCAGCGKPFQYERIISYNTKPLNSDYATGVAYPDRK